MPRVKVGGKVKHYPYTTKGKRAAAAARKRKPKTKKTRVV